MRECWDWEAWYNEMPGGDDSRLHVSGTCRCESSSIELELVPGNEGIVDQPELVVLELRSRRPDFGDDLVSDKPVTWEGEVGKAITRVRIQGEAEASIDVTIAR